MISISGLPEGTTHISKICAVSIPCFGFTARFNAFKYDNGVLKVYKTDSDNEYGQWIEARQVFKAIPEIFSITTFNTIGAGINHD